jgi:uncharacterized protein (DUF2336 family)
MGKDVQGSQADILIERAEDLSNRRIRERGRVLRKMADLFLSKSESYSVEQLELFDIVMMKLIEQVDREIRAYLANKLASVGHAPPRVMRHLANDDAIAVAGPVLQHSPCLDEEFLVGSAKSKNQEHLAAISLRRTIGHCVTDVLLERGDDRVMLTLAENSGAKFSERGYSMMVDRAKDSQRLACAIFNRADIPRHHMLALFEKASATVRKELEIEAGRKAEDIAVAVRLASQKLQEKSREESKSYASARLRVAALQQAGGLSESEVFAFARQRDFEEAVVAISEMCGLPTAQTERLMFEESCDRLFIVARAIGLSWSCVCELLAMNRTKARTGEQLERLRAAYEAIPRGSAVKTLQVHQLRQKARGGVAPSSDDFGRSGPGQSR